jgi:ABC-2 type transport system permease protein
MLHLLKIEWLKLKNYRTFWILTILYVISNYGVNFIGHYIFVDLSATAGKNKIAQTLIGPSPFTFPAVWESVSFMCSLLLFIPALLIIISVTNEFSYKTHRQNIVDGWSRGQFISVKLVLVVIASVFATLLAFLMGLVFGLQEGSTVSFERMEFLGYFFVQALSYCSVAMVFALLLKRSGLAIGVYFLYIVVLENLLGGLVSNNVGKSAGQYLPLNSTDALLPFPFFRTVTNNFLDSPNIQVLLPLAAAYLIVYWVFSVWRFKTDDL